MILYCTVGASWVDDVKVGRNGFWHIVTRDEVEDTLVIHRSHNHWARKVTTFVRPRAAMDDDLFKPIAEQNDRTYREEHGYIMFEIEDGPF